MYSYSTAAFLAAGCMGQHGGWAQTFHRLSCPNDLPEQTMRPNCPKKKRWSKQKVAPCLGGKGQTAVQGANACSNANAHEGVSLLVQKCLQCRRSGMGCVNKHLLVALRASASHVLLLSLSWQQGAWGVNSWERTQRHASVGKLSLAARLRSVMQLGILTPNWEVLCGGRTSNCRKKQ